MRKYKLKLANDETWLLFTDKTLDEVKQEILSNKWIKLSSYGWKPTINGYAYIPHESDIQTCNIVYVNEEVNYQKMIDEQEASKKERLEIIKEIESYKFNYRMKLWYFWNVRCKCYSDKELEHPLLSINKEYLNTILSKCSKYKCKKQSS